ncbi:RNA polymerase sigma factor [Streptantibioticus rubrisoli]|uniref:Sigma-70 family RNA polymerase sigma factor n=1 Tax=Streptantibioticus rubrisoli TaxID=1387313 RepID=A0ABT1P8N1_9ACTN|nr:sigma-70 family RNA polymerase sigma factor [Streptantibioticus rubrisoli]MCQ4041719.1 sigma-70 family RNA polymerase sigma factor [Streptantibioticus rubrisoli]
MTEEDRSTKDRGAPVAQDSVLPLPLDWEALYLANQETFHRYAYVVLRNNAAAEDAVHRAFLEILRHWDALLEESNLQQQVWAIFRRVVISEALSAFRKRLKRLPGDAGVIEALTKLPPRQFDAAVLRFVLKCDVQQVSWYMGVSASTVGHHCRKAKERLELAVPSLLKTEGDTE